MEYGLIGERLGHSYSKLIHERLADYRYELCPLTRAEFIRFMEKRDFKAINVTIPYKKAVLSYLDELDESAESIGAVNTIVNRDGKLIGYNTDYLGFLYMLKYFGIDPAGKKVLVLGTGGASAAVRAAFYNLEEGKLLTVSRTPCCADEISYEDAARECRDVQIICNTTPVGMYPDVNASPLSLAPFKNCEAVVDVIYNPGETLLVKEAKSLGMKGVTGLMMLVAQAKYACERFTGTFLSDDVIEPIYRDLAALMYEGKR